MTKFKSLESLETLDEQYDCFIFDIYGVLYDGKSLIKRMIDFIHHLREKNKAIVFLSNSQRRSRVVAKELYSRGFPVFKGEKLFTSGEYFKNFLSFNMEFKNKNVFYILGSSKHFSKTNIKLTKDLKEATCLIFTFSTHDAEKLSSCDNAMKIALKKGCELICINPDITAPHGNDMYYTPGYFAKRYEELGGAVRYFGKPYKEIYDFFIDKFLNKKGIDKQRTIAVGDSISTDIKGATDFGIDSLLVHSSQRKAQSSFNNHDPYDPTYSFEI
jgi:HAD superfamily hydrolase (TIGR01459 family)